MMHAATQAILVKAANAALLQNTSGNLAAHVATWFDAIKKEPGPYAPVLSVVEHELKVLGLLGSSNGGYLS